MSGPRGRAAAPGTRTHEQAVTAPERHEGAWQTGCGTPAVDASAVKEEDILLVAGPGGR
jgi:hypothetical protein